MKVFSIDLTKNKYNLIIIIAIIISVVLIAIVMFNIFNESSNLVEVNIYDEGHVLSYTASYTATIVSNKTINTYTIDEQYKKDGELDCFRFSFYDALDGNVTYIVKDDKVKITSENQLNSYISNYSKSANFNLLSTKTYLDILSNLYSEEDLCYYIDSITYTEDNEEKLTIILDDKAHDDCENCTIKDLYNKGLNINKIEITLDLKGYISYVRVYSEDELYIELQYNMLCINEVIDSSNFNIED